MKPNATVNHLAGIAAENSVLSHYEAQGYTLRAQRWRGGGGELDLVMERDGGLVFVEVKKSKSFAQALQRVTAQKVRRLYSCATAFLATWPTGLSTDSRFDIAVLDDVGRIEVLENAICA